MRDSEAEPEIQKLASLVEAEAWRRLRPRRKLLVSASTFVWERVRERICKCQKNDLAKHWGSADQTSSITELVATVFWRSSTKFGEKFPLASSLECSTFTDFTVLTPEHPTIPYSLNRLTCTQLLWRIRAWKFPGHCHRLLLYLRPKLNILLPGNFTYPTALFSISYSNYQIISVNYSKKKKNVNIPWGNW